MPRPSREQRRRDFLQTGAELAMQPPTADAEVRALAQVTVAAVARQAEMTRGSLYHLWPTQELYRFDLMRSLHAPIPSTDAGSDGDVDAAVAAAIGTILEDVAFRARLSFQPYSRSEAATGLMLDTQSALIDGVMGAIEAELQNSSRRLRSDFGIDHLRPTVAALVQGIGVIGLIQGATADDAVRGLVTATQEAVTAVIDHFTVPDD